MRKVLKALLLTILAYLFQVCAMNQLKIGGVVANLLGGQYRHIDRIPGQKICLWCVLRHRHSA